MPDQTAQRKSPYDQIEGADYGVCVDCGLALATADDAKEHRTETMSPGKASHRTRATNPTREERVQSMVDGVVSDAIEEALDELWQKVARADVTTDEISEALSWHGDFKDEWDNER